MARNGEVFRLDLTFCRAEGGGTDGGSFQRTRFGVMALLVAKRRDPPVVEHMRSRSTRAAGVFVR